jgi:hypothetical protein
MAWIDDGEAGGRFTKDEAFAMRTQVQTRLDPLMAKAAAARIAQENVQTQAMQAEGERQATLWRHMTGNWHATANQLAGVSNPAPGALRTIDAVDGQGNVLGHLVMTPEGKTVFTPKGAAGTDLNAAHKMWLDAAKEVRGEIDADIKMRRELMANEEKQPGFNAAARTTHPSTWEDANVRSGVFEILMRQRGFAPSWDQHAATLQGPRGGGMPGGSRPGPGGSDAAVPGMGRPTAERKPFDFERPETPEQKVFVAKMGEFDRQLKAALPPSDPRYAKFAEFIYNAAQTYRNAGSEAALGEEEKKWMLANINQFEYELHKLKQGRAAPKPETDAEYERKTRPLMFGPS